MVALFSMITNFLTAFILFFEKLRLFNNSASLLTNLRLWSRRALMIAAVAAITAYFALLVAFFYFTVDSIVSLYNMISTLFDKISSLDASDPIIQGAYFFFNVTGIAQGLSAAFPFIASALTFRLMQKLYKIIVKLNESMVAMYMRMVTTLTAA